MFQSILIFHVILSIGLITLILLQQGKGADVGASFGSGASQTLFGSRGSASFLTHLTGVLATLFFVTSLTLAYLSKNQVSGSSVTDSIPTTEILDELPSLNEAVSKLPEDVPAVPEVVQPPQQMEKAPDLEKAPELEKVPVIPEEVQAPPSPKVDQKSN